MSCFAFHAIRVNERKSVTLASGEVRAISAYEYLLAIWGFGKARFMNLSTRAIVSERSERLYKVKTAGNRHPEQRKAGRKLSICSGAVPQVIMVHGCLLPRARTSEVQPEIRKNKEQDMSCFYFAYEYLPGK